MKNKQRYIIGFTIVVLVFSVLIYFNAGYGSILRPYITKTSISIPAFFGDAEKQYELAQHLSPTEAIKWYQAAAVTGHTKARLKLANIHYNKGMDGDDKAQDLEAAFKLYVPLAEEGEAQAQTQLCWMYSRGIGVEQDYAQGFRWCEKAVAQNDPEALYSLGTYYLFGKGIEADIVKGGNLIERALKMGSASANKLERTLRTDCITPDHTITSDEQAQDCVVLAAMGNSVAQAIVGALYHSGEYREKDVTEAVYWLQRAAVQGEGDAQLLLGIIYAKGEGGIPQNYQAAYKLFSHATKSSDPNIAKSAVKALLALQMLMDSSSQSENRDEDVVPRTSQ